jgi:hypothetical protein
VDSVLSGLCPVAEMNSMKDMESAGQLNERLYSMEIFRNPLIVTGMTQ